MIKILKWLGIFFCSISLVSSLVATITNGEYLLCLFNLGFYGGIIWLLTGRPKFWVKKTIDIIVDEREVEWITTSNVVEAEEIIRKSIRENREIKINLSLSPSDFDYLAQCFPEKKIYLSLKVWVKINGANHYKGYDDTIEKIRQNYSLDSVVEGEKAIHSFETTTGDLYYTNDLPQNLRNLSRKTTVLYRSKEYSFSDFKSAVYHYKHYDTVKIEDFFDKNTYTPALDTEVKTGEDFNTINLSKTVPDFIAVDFETANNDRSSACSIGIITVSNGEITNKEHYYINPGKIEWGVINIRVHGIKPAIVENKPTFGELWKNINHHFNNTLVICHNASSFDISVLRACLSEHNIDYPQFQFGCTMTAAKNKGLDSKLKTLCERHKIDLKHHDAISDAEACARLAIHFYREDNSFNQFKITKFNQK